MWGGDGGMWGGDGMGGMGMGGMGGGMGMNPMMMQMMEGMMKGMGGTMCGKGMNGGCGMMGGGAGGGGGARSQPYGGGGGGGGSSNWKPPGELPEPIGLKIDESAPLCKAGYPTDICAIMYYKEQTLFSDANYILSSFFGGSDPSELVQFEYDPDCSRFPEIYRAWKAAGQDDNCPMVASCPSMGQWAVGMGGKMGATRAAKIAISLALAAVVDPFKLTNVCKHFPDFKKLCKASGIEVQANPPPPQDAGFQLFPGGGSIPPMVKLKISGQSSMVQRGFSQEMIAIEFDKEYSMFSDAHHIMQCFFDEMVGGIIEMEHDPECTNFPEVYDAWKAAGQGDNMPTIAKCRSVNTWAVGFGGKKNAERAAKLAMSVMLAATMPAHKTQVVAAHYPEFGKMCRSLGIQC